MASAATTSSQPLIVSNHPSISVEVQKPSVVASPYIVPRPQKQRQSRVKNVHFVVIASAILFVLTQFLMTRAQIVNLHYQIEDLNYQNDRILAERDAHYQHQAELSQLSRLKTLVQDEGLVLDGHRVIQLSE